jgi:Tat protein secretion system quality control protein TatD with DNase activity
MAITYKWTINALDAKISHDSKDNVINTIHWGYSASEEHEAGMYTASSIGTHPVEYDADNFTEYDSIQEADVIGWLENGLDVDSMKASLDSQIELLKAPVNITFQVPFAPSAEE